MTPDVFSAGDEAFARAHRVVAAAELDFDRVPAPVLRPRRGVAEKVLPAQLVGDAGRGGIQIARRDDDLGAAAAVVGERAERVGVDPIRRVAG